MQMKRFSSYVILTVCCLMVLMFFDSSVSQAKKKTVKGVTYTYHIVDAKKKEICITDAENVPVVYKIPKKIGKYKVAAVGKSAFAYCGIQKLTIQGVSLTRIDRFAFSQNRELLEVNFDKNYSQIYIGCDWFTDCPDVRIVIPKTVKTIETKVNANAGTLVLQGKQTYFKNMKKLSSGKYYLQFETVELPKDSKAYPQLKKAYYGKVNDLDEDRYDSSSNNYSNSTLKKVSLLPLDSVRISKKRLSVGVGKTTKLRVHNVLSSQKIIWSSKDASIATVDENGNVTGKMGGKTYIVATVGKRKCICKVTVSSGLTLEQIPIVYQNDIFNEEMCLELISITRLGNVNRKVYDKTGLLAIFSRLASLTLSPSESYSPVNMETDTNLRLHLEWQSGERTVVVYEKGYISIGGVTYMADRSVYSEIRQLVEEFYEW